MEGNFTRIKTNHGKTSASYGAEKQKSKSKDSKPWKQDQKKQTKRNWTGE